MSKLDFDQALIHTPLSASCRDIYCSGGLKSLLGLNVPCLQKRNLNSYETEKNDAVLPYLFRNYSYQKHTEHNKLRYNVTFGTFGIFDGGPPSRAGTFFLSFGVRILDKSCGSNSC